MKKRRFSDKGINFKLRKILIIMLFIFAFIFLVKIFLNYIEMKNKYDSVNNQINELKDENVKLESRIGKLYDDREYIEKVAREQLNMVKDGETVYIFTND
ncbi:MAG: septum formation initiator family protein [Candidatus Goldbacteria bacterium]|nr:septum formation initiator family protein [Candidatus Goldiibacteriota bacterium]